MAEEFLITQAFDYSVATARELTGLPESIIELALLLLVGLLGSVVLNTVLGRLLTVAQRSRNRWDDILVVALQRPAKWLLWIIVWYAALGMFEGLSSARTVLAAAADTGVVLLLGWFVHRFLAGAEAELLCDHWGPRDSDDRAAITATARLLRITLWLIVSIMALQSLGISVSGLLAFGGIGGIAVGFAAKDLLSNFLGGVSIFLDRPFAVGDWVRSPDRNIEGIVEHIGWRMTRIRTFDKRPLYVPNSVFSTVSLENPSRMTNRRIYETMGVRYGDVGRLKAIVDDVRAMLESHPDIDTQQTLIVNFVSCGASSLDFFVYTFTKTVNWVEFHSVKEDVMLKILGIIEAHGAEVAFPTRTLLIEGPEPDPQ